MNKRPVRPLAPGAWLGVLGGGQLGRMFAMAAHRLGYRVAVLDPDPQCPAAGAADRLICAPLNDPQAWNAMAELCAAVTIETENVPAAALQAIAQRIPVSPDANALVGFAGRTLVIPEAGHLPHVEAARQVNEALTDFIKGVGV